MAMLGSMFARTHTTITETCCARRAFSAFAWSTQAREVNAELRRVSTAVKARSKVSGLFPTCGLRRAFGQVLIIGSDPTAATAMVVAAVTAVKDFLIGVTSMPVERTTLSNVSLLEVFPQDFVFNQQTGLRRQKRAVDLRQSSSVSFP